MKQACEKISLMRSQETMLSALKQLNKDPIVVQGRTQISSSRDDISRTRADIRRKVKLFNESYTELVQRLVRVTASEWYEPHPLDRTKWARQSAPSAVVHKGIYAEVITLDEFAEVDSLPFNYLLDPARLCVLLRKQPHAAVSTPDKLIPTNALIKPIELDIAPEVT